jgi:Zn-dependent protease
MSHWWASDALELGGPVFLVSWVFWVIGSIVLHELAHGWVAIRSGDRTPIDSGHMTLNPVVHMGVPSLVVFALAGIAWGAMPVNPSRFRGRFDDAKVSFAGPLTNFLLGAVCICLSAAWIAFAGGRHGGEPLVEAHVLQNVYVFFIVGAGLNIALGVFNLLPVPPLDGSTVLASFVPSYRRMISSIQGPVAIIAVIVVMNVFGTGFLAKAFDGAMDASRFLTRHIVPGPGH